jgi:lycopene beta-cyclase
MPAQDVPDPSLDIALAGMLDEPILPPGSPTGDWHALSIDASLDLLVVGGGLSGSLLAWRLKQKAPGLRVRIIEAADRLGGNHTWSFFETDLTKAQTRWVDPLITYRWPAYEVRFPRFERRLAIGYRSISSERLHETIGPVLGSDVVYGAKVADISHDHVRLESGEILRAPCVIDARGARPSPHLALGFQKFLGLEVRLASPHGRTIPTIMDAAVTQEGSYRFVYTLPLDPHRLLIEDTYYSEDQALPVDTLRQRIHDYAGTQGWTIAEVVREEVGVLPIILAGDVEGFLSEDAGMAPRIGIAAGLFHPTTGYSLPDAVRLADRLTEMFAGGAPVTSASARAVIAGYGREVWRQRSYFRMLNRLLFHAGAPNERYRILQRFYDLNILLIQRFYACRLTTADRLRILVGKPPVSIFSALGCLSERSTWNRYKDR